MEALIIIGTNEFPTVILDKEKKIFEITGQSLPEEAITFYTPVIDWFEQYNTEPLEETILNLQLEYCNSSSTKALADVMEVLEELFLSGKKVEIHWLYAEDDDDMLEVGREFEEIIKVPFQFLPVKQE
jgi:hypothetical protein